MLTILSVVILSLSGAAAEEEEFITQVGSTIPQTFDMTGAATYRLPIAVPPGRNKIAPNLALTYNSNVKNGYIGVGWSLDMGSIQRSTKHGVDYSGDDYVATANGSTTELVSRSGEWGSNYYGAKIEGAFIKYEYKGAAGWEVTARDGIKYFYGQTAASQQDNANGVFKWRLDRVEDPNGNYMTVSYIKNQGQIYLNRIDYTGNSGLAAANYVKFYYDTNRLDAPPLYTTNSEVVTSYRLRTIDVHGNGSRARAYALNYDTGASTWRSRLISVQQYGTDATIDGNGIVTGGTSLPAVTLASTSPGSGFGSESEWANNNNWGGAGWKGFADFNGDCKQDFWYVVAGTSQVMVRLCTGSSFATASLWSFTVNWYQAEWLGFADLNGDSMQDLWFVNPGTSRVMVRLSTGSEFAPEVEWANNNNWAGEGWRGFADFNSDNKQDLWFVNPGTSRVLVRLSTGSSFVPELEWANNNNWAGLVWIFRFYRQWQARLVVCKSRNITHRGKTIRPSPPGPFNNRFQRRGRHN